MNGFKVSVLPKPSSTFLDELEYSSWLGQTQKVDAAESAKIFMIFGGPKNAGGQGEVLVILLPPFLVLRALLYLVCALLRKDTLLFESIFMTAIKKMSTSLEGANDTSLEEANNLKH